jgi:CheY-like chemotaxis protein
MAKLLIAEDDVLMSRMYHKIFTFEHFDVALAANGEEAIELVTKEHPTMILLDVMMPKMNGFQVLEKLKANPDTRDIPVVMLTNLASESDAENAMLKGAVKYIVKSQYDHKKIVEMVKEVIAGYTRNEIPTVSTN